MSGQITELFLITPEDAQGFTKYGVTLTEEQLQLIQQRLEDGVTSMVNEQLEDIVQDVVQETCEHQMIPVLELDICVKCGFVQRWLNTGVKP